MTIAILLAVAIGIISGIFLAPASLTPHIGSLINGGLILVLLLVGISVGRQTGFLKQLRRMGLKVLLVPLSIALGSILGGIAGGLLLGIPWHQAGAVGAGFGWYSFAGIELSRHSPYLGTLAFITNMAREMIALVTIPLIAKYLGKLECVATAGSPAMTVALPVISSATKDANITIIAFISGMTLGILVPLVVPFMMTLG